MSLKGVRLIDYLECFDHSFCQDQRIAAIDYLVFYGDLLVWHKDYLNSIECCHGHPRENGTDFSQEAVILNYSDINYNHHQQQQKV